MTKYPGTGLRQSLAAGALLLAGMIAACLCQTGFAAQPPEGESPLLHPAAPVQRIELKPVLKPEPGKVRLTPVLIGEPKAKATPKPVKPRPAVKPEPVEQPVAEPVEAPARVKLRWIEAGTPKQDAAASPEPVALAEAASTTATAEVAQAGVKQEVPVIDMTRPEYELAQAVTLPGVAPPDAPSAEAGARLDEVKRLLDAGNVAQARRSALELADGNPNAPEVPEARYLAATALQDLSQACAELHQLVLDHPRAPITRQALSRLGEFSFILGKYDETVKAYTAYRMIETDREALRGANLQLAIAALRGRKYDMAEAEYAALLRNYPDLNDSPDALEGLAEAQLAVGRIADAAQTFQSIDSRFPGYESAVTVTMGRGLCAELLGRTAEALEFYARILRDYPQSVEAGLAARRRDDLARPLVAGA